MNLRHLINELNEMSGDPEMEIVITSKDGTRTEIHEVCYNSHTNELNLLAYDRYKELNG